VVTAANSAPSTGRQQRTLGYAACAGAGCLWSTGFYFGKIALTELSVGHMVLYRFLFACVGLVPIMRWPGFSRKEWAVLATASFLGVPLQFLIQFYGLSLTTVSHAALMVGTMPVILALGATVFAHERLNRLGWLALAGSTTGVALIVSSKTITQGPGARPTLTGDLMVVLSLVIALGWVLLNKRLVARHSALSVTAWGLVLGTMMLAPWVVVRNGLPPVHGLSTPVWAALAASGVLCTAVTTLLWNWGNARVPASRAGVFLNIEPALGSVLGVELLGDHLGPLAWVGGALIVAAAITLTSTGQSETEFVLE
jgi:drug/metabolite transporter (DMT)-like permease